MAPTFDAERALRYAEELRSRARQLEAEVSQTEIDVRSRDKTITVTVTIPGKIKDLKLHHSATEDRSPGELAEAVLATLQNAQEIGERAGRDLASRYLPDVPDLGDVLISTQEKGRSPR